MTSLEGPWHVLVKRALAVSAPIISTSICYIGQFRTLIFQRPLRGSNACARRAKFVPGACPTSQSAKWKTYSVFHKGIAVYSIGDRTIERDLLPWCEQHGMPVMAYSPLGGPGARLLHDPTLARIGAAHGCSAAAVALAWTIRSGHVLQFPNLVLSRM